MLPHTPSKEQVCKPVQDILMCQVPYHFNGKAFSRVLIQHCHHAEAPAIPGSRVNEVIVPHMVAMFRTKPYAGAVVKPQSRFG